MGMDDGLEKSGQNWAVKSHINKEGTNERKEIAKVSTELLWIISREEIERQTPVCGVSKG